MRCKVWKHSLPILLVILLLCAVCTACGNEEKKIVRFFSMDTLMEITAYGDCSDALQQARDRIETLDALLNTTDPQSGISALKNGDLLSADIAVPLQTAQKIALLTDGALDITLAPVIAAWGFYSKQYRVPTEETIQTLLKNRGAWSIRDGRLECTGGVQFDLGSVAKGYAAQCAADVLRQNGVTAAVLALGGNVQTLGSKPDGKDWTISVADPRQEDAVVGNLHVGECAVVTSGSYQRYFEENGKTYHHILDPSTGCPAQSGLLSATVVCEDGTTADALSTALFIKGSDFAKALYAGSDISFEALFITENNELFLTEGLADRFEQTGDFYAPYQILQ